MPEGALSKQETIKQQIGDPFKVWAAIERGVREGYQTLTPDELFLLKWFGLYEHRHEKGFFMLRLKIPNGFLSPPQLRTIATIATKQNKGFADITTRQDIQLHWIAMADAINILEQLQAAGITTMGACGDVARNVVGCPVAGVEKDEVLDGSATARALSEFLTGKPEYANLPRKYKIAVAGCRTLCCHPEIQCVGLVGIERQTNGHQEVGYDLRVGGGLSTQPFYAKRLNAFVKPDRVIDVVRVITELWRDEPAYREKRHHARLKYMIHDWGVEKFRAAMEARLGYALDNAPADYQDPPDRYRDHVGVYEQKQPGLYYVGAPVLVGRIYSDQMLKVADLAERYAVAAANGAPPIRLTNRQNLILLNIPEEKVENVLRGLSEVGLSINAHPVRRGVVTCTGTEFCNLAISETKLFSKRVVEYLEQKVGLDEPIRLHITGCPNACAQYQIAHIGLMGSKTKVGDQTVDAYDVLVGGQLGPEARFVHPIVRKIAATEIPERLRLLLEFFKKQRKSGEPFNGFCARVGDAKLAELLSGRTGAAQKKSGQYVAPGEGLPKPLGSPGDVTS